jgi:hypothetical protein
MIHRLQWGGPVQVTTLPSLLEGGQLEGPSLSDPKLPYVQGCRDLNDEVQALHDLARSGVISTEAAERQLNTYLLAASNTRLLTRLAPARRRWLLLPITDAPFHGLVPDLGMVIHRVLSRDPMHSAVSAVVEQCIPSMRHVCRAVQYTDSQEILLNLVLALLLGLFPGSPKKPGFSIRAVLWGRVHALLTDSRERQTAFLEAHQDILTLACMEYLARLLPLYMPAQDAFLTGRDAPSSGFFRRIPPICDEFRQTLDEMQHGPGEPSWAAVQRMCAGHVERVSRLKRAQPSPAHKDGPREALIKPLPAQIPAHWDVPQLLHDPTPDEYRLLGLSLGLQGSMIMQIQQDLQINPLPPNLTRIQMARLLDFSRGETRMAYPRTHR